MSDEPNPNRASGLNLAMPRGFSCRHYQIIDSTSRRAWRLIAAGPDADADAEIAREAERVESGLWLLADEQSRGHGRRGASWASPPGNLYASLYLRLALPPSRMGQIAIIAALAAMQAVDQLAPAETLLGQPCLKWPNDILLFGGKLGGVLVESRPAAVSGKKPEGEREPDGAGGKGGESVNAFNIVIGFGLNISSSPSPDGNACMGQGRGEPGKQVEKGRGNKGPDAARPLFAPTHLHAHGWSCSRDELFIALARSMRDWLAIWRGGDNFSEARLAWLDRSCHMGRALRLEAGGGEMVKGRMAGIDELGCLILAGEDGERRFLHDGHILAVED
jgi:BirA family biotin operon repressor/biotin-[acetyl-CoA-carboxylase] ligase